MKHLFHFLIIRYYIDRLNTKVKASLDTPLTFGYAKGVKFIPSTCRILKALPILVK